MDLLFQSRRIFRDLFFNFLTIFLNIFIKRDSRVILFGGRFGNRFSGNARFLFQYCVENKEKMGFKHVIWVTRSNEVYRELSDMGYEVYKMHSIISYYWHLKAGRHIIGGAFCPERKNGEVYKSDILSVLSMGAECIFLRHVAFWIKGNPRAADSPLTNSGIRFYMVQLFQFLYNSKFIRNFALYPGGWDHCTILSRSKSTDIYDRFNKYVIAGLPEMCPCLKLTPSESSVLDRIKKSGKKIVLYTPTHRTVYSPSYVPPLNDENLLRFLKENNYFWIEKLHPSAPDYMRAKCYDSECAILLDNRFDINVITQYSDLMITDYSTTYQKAIWYYKPYLFYAPDLNHYLNKDFGLSSEFIDFVGKGFICSTGELISSIKNALTSFNINDSIEKYNELRNKYFDVEGTDYQTIVNRLLG